MVDSTKNKENKVATSVFENLQDAVWKWRFETTIVVSSIAGGIPTDERVVESWLRTKVEDKDDAVRRLVAETMAERGVTADEAVKAVGSAQHFTGFKRDKTGLYIDGRQVKAALKEAVMVAVGAGNVPLRSWGVTSKFAKGFVAEHIMVTSDRVYLCEEGTGNPVQKPTDIVQQFVHTQYGSAPHYKEYVEDAELRFVVITDFDFEAAHPGFWHTVWLTGQEQGIGASRSGGFGRYKVTNWELISNPPKSTGVPKAGSARSKSVKPVEGVPADIE